MVRHGGCRGEGRTLKIYMLLIMIYILCNIVYHISVIKLHKMQIMNLVARVPQCNTELHKSVVNLLKIYIKIYVADICFMQHCVSHKCDKTAQNTDNESDG